MRRSVFSSEWRLRSLAALLLLVVASARGAEALPPMLLLADSGADPTKIDFKKLPVLKGEHGLVSKGAEPWLFRLHSYLAFYDGKFWCMWSHGPKVEDYPTQHVRYATSDDGLHWSAGQFIAPPPIGNERYIARGFWEREGRLIALATLDGKVPRDKTPWAPDLRLLGFEWNVEKKAWRDPFVISADTLSNFPPQKLRDGNWLMMRRDHKRAVSILIGGVASPSDWQIVPTMNYGPTPGSFRAEEPGWWELPDGRLLGVYRDNSNSMRLYRAMSLDQGRTWSAPEKTNFPDATSKFFGMRTSRGYYVLVSNANPITNESAFGRNPLCLSVSDDGMTFTRMARLPIPVAPEGGAFDANHISGTLQYPHVVEVNGSLVISYSREKMVIETVKIALGQIELLRSGKLVP